MPDQKKSRKTTGGKNHPTSGNGNGASVPTDRPGAQEHTDPPTTWTSEVSSSFQFHVDIRTLDCERLSGGEGNRTRTATTSAHDNAECRWTRTELVTNQSETLRAHRVDFGDKRVSQDSFNFTGWEDADDEAFQVSNGMNSGRLVSSLKARST